MPRGRPKGSPGGPGRKPLPLDQRKPNKRRGDKITIEIAPTPEDALLAQRLMLRDWPGVRTIGDLLLYALRTLAETMDQGGDQ